MARYGVKFPCWRQLNAKEGVVLGRLVSVSVRMNRNSAVLYADDRCAESDYSAVCADITVETDDLTDETAAAVLGQSMTGDVLSVSRDNTPPEGALGYYITVKRRRTKYFVARVFTRVYAMQGDEQARTRGKTGGFQTCSLQFRAFPDGAGGLYAQKTFDDEAKAREWIRLKLAVKRGGSGSGGEILLSSITVRSGRYSFVEQPASGYDGIGSVVVEGDANLVPENIRGGVSILGVTGAYQKEAVRLVKRSVTVSKNGKQTVATPSGFDGIAAVSIETDVPTEVNNRTPDAVTPSWQAQTIWPGEGYTGLDRVVVRGDGNLRDGRYIAKGHAIFGVEGEYGEEPQTVDVDPAVSLPVRVEPDTGYVLERVNIPKPDTLRPINIARGVVIFGVTGTLDSDVNNYPSVSVTPGASRQTIDPEAFGAYTGLERVIVLPVAGLEAENIRVGAEVGGVTGTYRGDLADAVVLPSFDEQLILPAAGYTGFGSVTVQGIDTDAVIWSGSREQYEAMSHVSGKLYAVWKEDGA